MSLLSMSCCDHRLTIDCAYIFSISRYISTSQATNVHADSDVDRALLNANRREYIWYNWIHRTTLARKEQISLNFMPVFLLKFDECAFNVVVVIANMIRLNLFWQLSILMHSLIWKEIWWDLLINEYINIDFRTNWWYCLVIKYENGLLFYLNSQKALWNCDWNRNLMKMYRDFLLKFNEFNLICRANTTHFVHLSFLYWNLHNLISSWIFM